jgi:hypothetical protein
MRNALQMTALFLAAMIAVGCGDDPISYSQPVTINLKAKSGDVSASVVSGDKSITTESGNPYGEFISDSRDALAGSDPSAIELDSVTLLLGAQSTGVTQLQEIFGGQVDVLFVMNDSNNSHTAAFVVGPTGSGPVALSSNFDSTAMGSGDYAKLLQGSFKVVIRGPAATAFESKGAEADLQLTFGFVAFE